MMNGRGGYKYNSKIVREGILEKVKELKESGRSFPQIAEECGLKTRQQAYEIYQRSIANKY